MGTEVTKSEKKCWSVFACIGLGLGIGTLATFWLVSLPLISGVPGIVFSVLGLNSTTHHKKAKSGLILSIIGASLAFLLLILYISLIIGISAM